MMSRPMNLDEECILCKMVWHFISLSKVVGEQYIDSSQKHYL